MKAIGVKMEQLKKKNHPIRMFHVSTFSGKPTLCQLQDISGLAKVLCSHVEAALRAPIKDGHPQNI